jgi:hypothetical protein
MPWADISYAHPSSVQNEAHQCDPCVDSLVVQEPVRKRALGTHHVRIFLRCHPLLILLGQLWSVDLSLEIILTSWRVFVRWRSVLIRLRYYGRLLLRSNLSSSELFREAAFGGDRGVAERCGRREAGKRARLGAQ